MAKENVASCQFILQSAGWDLLMWLLESLSFCRHFFSSRSVSSWEFHGLYESYGYGKWLEIFFWRCHWILRVRETLQLCRTWKPWASLTDPFPVLTQLQELRKSPELHCVIRYSASFGRWYVLSANVCFKLFVSCPVPRVDLRVESLLRSALRNNT